MTIRSAPAPAAFVAGAPPPSAARASALFGVAVPAATAPACATSAPRRLRLPASVRACAVSDAVDAAVRGSGRTTPPPVTSPLVAKYGHLRGADVEPVSDAVARFATRFSRPVPVVYRSLINELIVSTHLSRVCAMWRYCGLFALGVDDVFVEFLRFYPGADERDDLYDAVAYALSFSREKLRADADAIRQWCLGKTEQDVFDAAAAANGPLGEALAQAARGDPVDEWYYSRPFGVGLVRVMAAVNVDLTVADMERWADAMSLPKSKLATEMAQYISAMERLKQAEQMFAEASARDARKTAERLAERATAAKAAADALEADHAYGQGPTSDEDGTQTAAGADADAKAKSAIES